MNQFLKEEAGVLTFEWILLITILVIGIIGGLAAVRDSISSEMGDVSAVIINQNPDYSYPTVQTSLSYTKSDGTNVANAGVSKAAGAAK